MTFPIIALLLKSMNWSCLFMSLFNRGCLYYMQVCCILYFVCRISLSVIYIYILLLWYFYDICSYVYVDMEGHWTLQRRMAACFQLKMANLIFAALYQYLLVWSTLGRFVSYLHLMFLFLRTYLHVISLSIVLTVPHDGGFSESRSTVLVPNYWKFWVELPTSEASSESSLYNWSAWKKTLSRVGDRWGQCIRTVFPLLILEQSSHSQFFPLFSMLG